MTNDQLLDIILDLIEKAELEKWTELDLSNCQLSNIPLEIAQLHSLQILDLHSNQISDIPPEIAQLHSLQILDLHSNQISNIPPEIAQLNSLQILSLSSNQISYIPPEIAQLPSIQILDLNNNQISNIPSEISQLRSLHTLKLSSNQISNIPPEIAQLKSLQSLVFSNNKISNVPPEIAQLHSLHNLYLSNNKISDIPSEIAQLHYLKILLLDNNKISNIPPEIGQLHSLIIFKIDDNPLNPELQSIYEQGLNKLKIYLQSQQEKEIILNEVKLIFVGEGEVGKSSLLAALRKDKWIENRPTTHGVEIDIKSLILVDKESNTEITFNGWDFGGQNIYRYTHQMFFTTPAIYLAVWNPRRGPENCRVDEWIKMIKHRTYDEKQEDYQPRILVIATHGGPKERLDHIDEQLLRNEFDDLIVDFHHVDSYTTEGLEILENKLAKIATEMPMIRRSVPASWKIILDTIREKSQVNSWITYEQFLELCIDKKIDLALAKTYLTLLNELGYLIYYKHDPILKDTIILKPEWLSKAISFVLESREVKNNFGLVTHQQLSELWNDPKRGEDRYPEALHPIFRKLMERCDLSYQVELPDADALPTNLIAQLVPSQRPQHWENEWILKSGDKELTEVCRITDVQTGRTEQAEGLIYRLIVRFHPYSLGRQNYNISCHWKTGMLLDNGVEGRAFIEDRDGDIYITVRAAYLKGFLGYLSSEIMGLIKRFWKGLDPRLYIPCPTNTCQGLIEKDEIIEFKQEEISKVRCPVCRKFHKIDDLMAVNIITEEWDQNQLISTLEEYRQK